MKRHILVIMIVSVLLTLLAIIAIWTQIVPQYQAKAELRIRPIIPRLVFQTDNNGPVPFYDSFVNTQVSVMRSSAVLQRVLDEKKIKETQWYKNPTKSLKQRLSGDPIPPIERLRTNLSVYARHGTEIVEASFNDPNAKDAKLIVDSVLDNYLKYVGEMTNQDEQKLYRALVEQYESLEREIVGREKTISGLTKSLKTEDPQKLINIVRIRLDDTKNRLMVLRQNISLLESAMEDGNDPAVILGETQVTTTDTNAPGLGQDSISVEQQLTQAKRQEELLIEDLKKQQVEFDMLFDTVQLLNKENRALEHKRNLFNAIRQRLDQKNIERNVRDVIAPVEVLTSAFASSEPYKDSRVLLTVIFLILCLVMNSGIVLLSRIRTGKDKKDN